MSTQKDKSISVSKIGMNKDVHISNLQESEYRHAKNANFFDEGGNGFNIQNEHSNVLASKFKEGFKVIGFLNDVNVNKTVYFLKNEETGVSEIGQIKTTTEVPDLQDQIVDCDDCNQAVQESPALEDIEQTPHQVYETLLNDECNGCLNFSIDFPIKTVVFKNEKLGQTLYFTDNHNPPRYLQLDNLEQYSFEGNVLCGEDNTVATCVDCKKLKMFKDTDFPVLTPSEVILGGNLKRGTYQFLLAYSDEAGNELSRYFTVTEPVPIFDLQNNILEKDQIADETNFAIKLSITGLDEQFTHYKVVVIQNADISQAESYFVAGIYSTSNQEVIYTTDNGKTGISFNRIAQFATRIEKVEKFSTANNYLIAKGFEDKNQPNLQKVVNLLGSYVQWQSHIATENLYKDSINAAKYKQFTRDETYPLAIRFLQDGEYSFTFPLVGRMPSSFDLEAISESNKDRQSLNKTGSTCSQEGLTQRWQLYNTAEKQGNFEAGEEEGIETQTVTIRKEEACFIGDEENPLGILENGSIVITLEQGQEFSTLENFLRSNIQEILDTPDGNLPPDLLQIKELFSISEYTNENCTPEFDPECDAGTIELTEESIELIQALEEDVVFIPAEFPEEYPSVRPPQNCNLFATPSGGSSNPPTAYEGTRNCWNFLNNFTGRTRWSYLTSEFPFETEPSAAEQLSPITDLNTNVSSFFVNYYFALEAQDLLTNKVADEIVSSWNTSYTYPDRLHQNAKWFSLVNYEDEFVFSMSRDNNSTTNFFNTREYRVSFYTSIGNTIAPFYSTTKNILSNLNIKFKKEQDDLVVTQSNGTEITISGGWSNSIFVAIDTPSIPLTYLIGFHNCTFDSIFTEEGKNLWVTQEVEDPQDPNETIIEETPANFFTPASTGCFSIALLNGRNSAVEIDYEFIKVGKRQVYEKDCNYEIPIINDDCKAIPFEYGKMGYVESTEIYPDNSDLYNSTDLEISPEDLSEEEYINGQSFRDFFEQTFTEGQQDGKYVLKQDWDLRCQNIRHFKFPDNKVSSFINQTTLPDFADSTIFPLGVKIDGTIVSNLLDIAVKNNLLTQEQREAITGFELLRGDRTANKSVVAKGITFDMYEYEKQNRKIKYSNYPLNSLGADNLHYADSSRNNFIDHPSQSLGNYQWTFNSPETDYETLTIPSIMKVEGYTFGSTVGNFDLVEDHPKWTILGRRLERTAGILATVEIATEAVILSMEAFSNYNQVVGFSNTVFSGAWVASPVIAALNTVTAVVFKYARYKYEWLEIFRNLGKRRNFAAYYTTVGKFNRLNTGILSEGDILRSLNIRTNIKDGRFIVTDNIEGERTEINHMDREKAVLLSTGSSFDLTYPSTYSNYDNTNTNRASRTFASQALACANGMSEDVERRAASMYVSLKNYLPSQYGSINSVSWVPISQRGYFDKTNLFFGGDTYICRHTLRRPMPFFIATAFNQADMTPYEYKFYANIGDEPRFYCNFETDTDEREGGTLLPFKSSEYEFDCAGSTRGSYIKEPAKFYLWYNGIPSFLTETEINTNFRYAKANPWDNFYPNEADYMRWTQEKENPVRRGNNFYYNQAYSKSGKVFGVLQQANNYNKKDFDKINKYPNGVTWSLPDNNENTRFDPWLIFRLNDRYEFPTDYGKLNQIQGIENEQVLAIFENTSAIYNAVDQMVDDGQVPGARQMGLGGLFARRARVFSETDLGFAGTQHYPLLSCEYGHFFVDSDRGQIFKVATAGQGIEEISSVANGEQTGMKNWFKENLPFKIKNYFPGVDIDNPFNGFGITMGYDSRFKRIFITKIDAVPINKEELKEVNGVIYKGEQRATSEDFKYTSWTVSYNLETAKFASFFDFKPNYYVNHNNFFQTGINQQGEEFGLWSHLLTNKSFQVFYGKPYKWEIEVPVQTKLINKVLESFSYSIDSRRYFNEYDFIQNKELGFDQAYIYNNSNHSGQLKLKLQKTLRELSQYPKTEGTTQTILQTQQDGIMRFNYFYNRVKNEFSGLPLFKNDLNGVDKKINTKAISFFGKKVLERMRGDSFIFNLSSTETRHKKIFKFSVTSKNLYTK